MWNEVTANIFDPIQQTLDQRVFKGDDPRPSIATFIKKKFFSTMRDTLVDDPESYFDLYLTGSLTTYQYSSSSDCDISVFPDYDKLMSLLEEDSPEDVRRELITIVTTELDGTILPSCSHPLQFFVMQPGVSPGDKYKAGERSAWNLQTGGWLVSPEVSRSHDVAQEMPDLYQRAQDIAEKMQTLLDARDYDAAREMFAQIHKKRSMDEQAGLGDFSEGNIVYKWLLHQGLFDRLREEAGVHIAKIAKEDDPENIKVIYDFQKDTISLGTTASDDDLPSGSIILGTYNGREVHLHNVAKQWVNANYFKKLWLYSFPSRPIEKIYFDKNEVPTRPSDQMTYTQKLPHLTAKDPWRKGKDWKDFIKNEGIIVDFQFGDPKDDAVEAEVIDVASDHIKIRLKSGDTRILPKDLLKDIRFKVRDEKRSISHIATFTEDPSRTLNHYAGCTYEPRDDDWSLMKLARNWWTCPGCQKTSWWHGDEWVFRFGYDSAHGLEIEDQDYYNNTHYDMVEKIYGEPQDAGEINDTYLGYGSLDTRTGVLTIDVKSYDFGDTGPLPSEVYRQIQQHYEEKGFTVKEIRDGMVIT